jgi:hypothetical protein
MDRIAAANIAYLKQVAGASELNKQRMDQMIAAMKLAAEGRGGGGGGGGGRGGGGGGIPGIPMNIAPGEPGVDMNSVANGAQSLWAALQAAQQQQQGAEFFQSLNPFTGNLISAIKIDGGNHGFHCIGKQGFLAASPCQHLGTAQLQHSTNIYLAGDIRTGFLAHQRVEPRGQQPFSGGGIGVEQSFSHNQPQHTVAQKLKPLVVIAVRAGHGRMRHRADQKLRLGKFVAKPAFEGAQLG